MFILLTHYQHPLTGDSEPISRKLSVNDTFNDILEWYYKAKNDHGHRFTLDDLRIVEVEND